jgi:hypothetical protein
MLPPAPAEERARACTWTGRDRRPNDGLTLPQKAAGTTYLDQVWLGILRSLFLPHVSQQ